MLLILTKEKIRTFYYYYIFSDLRPCQLLFKKNINSIRKIIIKISLKCALFVYKLNLK